MPKLGVCLIVMVICAHGCAGDSASQAREVVTAGSSGSARGAGMSVPATAGTAGQDAFGNSQGASGRAGVGGATERPQQPTSDVGKCGAVSQMAENTLQPVDIIFGIDTTGSMGEEIAFTEENMNAFSQRISAAGIDVHVILVAGPRDGVPTGIYVDGVCIGAPLGSGNCPDDSNAPTYVHIPQLMADWDILQNYIATYPMYKQYLRESSFKTFVSISDSDPSSNPVLTQPINSADAFVAAVQQLEPASPMWMSWRYSAIYSFTACGIGNDEGRVHSELVKRTHGVAGDLCLQDFKPVFDELAKQVVDVVTLACDWEIPPSPMGETFAAGKTNVELTLDGALERLGKAQDDADCGTRDAWHYDDEAAPHRVVACPSTCARIQAARSAKVDVLFGCDTKTLPPLL
jgi:hypothetical protein